MLLNVTLKFTNLGLISRQRLCCQGVIAVEERDQNSEGPIFWLRQEAYSVLQLLQERQALNLKITSAASVLSLHVAGVAVAEKVQLSSFTFSIHPMQSQASRRARTMLSCSVMDATATVVPHGRSDFQPVLLLVRSQRPMFVCDGPSSQNAAHFHCLGLQRTEHPGAHSRSVVLTELARSRVV